MNVISNLKPHWLKLQARFTVLQPREQLLITVVGAIVLLALCDWLFWTPLARSTAQTQKSIADLQAQYTKLQNQHAEVKARLAEDPNAELQRNIDAVRTRITAQNKRLEELTVDLISPDKMTDVLSEVLSQRHELQLVALQNEPATYAFMPGEKVNKTPEEETAENANSPVPVIVFRHGLTLQLKGRYFEIVNYLQALEQLPWHFYWQKLDYKVDKYPNAIVTLQVYTLSYRESWIGA
jgi:MSHA biogenesis protein MshJ